ncbi:hypothetical protein HIM_11605 [Hirsutella minnesotensis 3608]|uniref:NmrA-like domain-containing protein n=1 Tax=Hirsutella minnesotensis 3608 TaxID=1043627 RepID=A0A0F7ZR51_9HYPO|nr:hypothetical protein HIM_11605 [Hirsutella minnesotensis 3608]
MSGSIKNVTLAGATGSLGRIILDKLVLSNKFNIRVLRRQGSNFTSAAGTDVVDVDFNSVASLAAALGDQDAVISVLGSSAITMQKILIDASIAAGVKRFVPSEFGANIDDAKTRAIPWFAEKVKIQDYLLHKSTISPITYTFVYNGAFLDWGLEHDFILKISDYRPRIIDGGDSIFSTTSLPTIGDAVVGLLLHPEETRNRSVFIHDIKVSQNQLLALAKQTAPNKPWKPEHVKLDDITAVADVRLAQGLTDARSLYPYLYRAAMDPTYGNNFPRVDNELLGLKLKSEEDIVQILKRLIK